MRVAAFAMWMCMMVAMMLPATTPTIDAFATIAQRRHARRQPYTPTLVFVAGYLLAWSGFSAAAVVTQWQLYRAALLTPTLQNTSPVLAGAALLVAGLYQFTPVKMACLRGCRCPLSFIMTEWREGHSGALAMGVRHGLSLRRLLLGADVAHVLCLGDGLALGRGFGNLCRRRKAHSRRRHDHRAGFWFGGDRGRSSVDCLALM